MKHFFAFALLMAAWCAASAQGGVAVRGKVSDGAGKPVAGATVTVQGFRRSVNTNANGEFYLQGLPAEGATLVASFAGYEPAAVDVSRQSGVDEISITLSRSEVALEPVTVTAQQREQQMLDIPMTMSTLSAQMLENTATRDLEQLSNFVPGLNIRIQTPHRPSFVIRGLTSDEVSPTAQPRVSVYFNNVPTSRASMAVTELYDMERVEVIKGPLGTLFGRGAQVGAVNFITKKPAADFGGYVSASLGSFSMREAQGAVNIPILKNKLTARAAGIYSYQDGFVKNTSGGTLNGKNTAGGRFSLSYLPVRDLKLDFVASYQNDDNPGTAFMSKRFPNANGVKDIFTREATLDSGKAWYNRRKVFTSSLDAKYYLNASSYLSSTTSFAHNDVAHRWDGDGTLAPAIDMAEFVRARQLTQELRYSFSPGSRLNGFVGASYWRENVEQRYWFNPNEQHMAYLIISTMLPGNPPLITDDGKAYPITHLPNNSMLGMMGMTPGSPLPTYHEEENKSGAVNQAGEIFADVTLLILPKLSLTAGIRGAYEAFTMSNTSYMVAGENTVLGLLFPGPPAPNLFFKPVPDTTVKRNFASLTYRASLKYDFNPRSTAYVGYSKGRRPNVIQYNQQGEFEVMSDETVHSFDAGLKLATQRLWLDVGVFYQLYRNFQTSRWDAMSIGYLVDDAGSATSYGAEATARAAVWKYLEVFGNYAYIHARFDGQGSNGQDQEYAGNAFRLTPDHSFAVGFSAKADVARGLQLVFTPACSWRSHVWFEDANDLDVAGLEQNAYGLLSANLALRFGEPGVVLSVFGTNLLNEKFIIGAGNTGMMFGVPTYVPGMPRMLGAKLRWDF
jgi:outer membrane receptor protein involved in Fe transport